MHYDDEEVVQNAILKVVVYTNTEDMKLVKWWDIMSIQECKYINPHTLIKFLNYFQNDFADEITQPNLKDFPYFENLKKLPPEEWFLITFSQNESCELIWVDVQTNIMNLFKQEPFLGLH